MRVRRKYWFVPVLAILGILLALIHFLNSPLPPNEARLIFEPEQPGAETAPAPAPPPPTEKAPPPAEPAKPSGEKDKPQTTYTEAEIQAIRSEMKISLAALYGGQKSFFSEYNRYTTDLHSIGYFPEGQQVHIKAGFLAPFNPAKQDVPDEDPKSMSFDEIRSNSRNSAATMFSYAQGVEGINLADAAPFCQMGCTANEKKFEIVVAANLDSDPDLEVWTITDQKVLTQVSKDL